MPGMVFFRAPGNNLLKVSCLAAIGEDFPFDLPLKKRENLDESVQ